MKRFHLLIIALITCHSLPAQNVGIGTNAPNASAALEIKASTKGLLIPRTSTASRTAIVNPAKGLILYDTTASSFWFYNGSAWVNLSAGGPGSGWALTGNAGTSPAANFIGTTDAQPLTFKVNNTGAGFIDNNPTGNAAFGYQSLVANTTGFYNTAIGYGSLKANKEGGRNTANGFYTLYANLSGENNTANGVYALSANTIGINNVATGVNSLSSNTEGNYNTANGTNALYTNQNGSYNTATGFNALQYNIDGVNNTAIGAFAGPASGSLSNATAIGANAVVSASNSLVLGNNVKVGVGISSPQYNLDVRSSENDAIINVKSGLNSKIIMDKGNVYGSSNFLDFQTVGIRKWVMGTFDLNENFQLYNYALGGTAIMVNAANNNVGFGTNNPTEKLDVIGLIKAYGYRCRPGTTGITGSNSFNIYWTGSAAQLWIDEVNIGTFAYTSDRRLKDQIKLMDDDALKKMLALKPVRFHYKKIDGTVFEGNPMMQEGFVADELQQVIPSAVNGEKNALTTKGTIQPQTVNIIPVVAVLTKAVQEQQQQIEALKKENAQLKAMQADIDMLKAALAKKQ
jgi:hypothetical protein